MVMGTHGVVASGHYLATGIGMDILRRGGNAFDAAAGVGFALALLKPHQNGIAGEVPMVVYSAGEGKVWAVSGHGYAPAAATLEKFRELQIDLVPGDGFLPAVVPPAVASWILLLERFGTMRLADVLSPAVELADRGFGMYDALHNAIKAPSERFRKEWPSSAETFTPGDCVPQIGSVWRNPGWAETLGTLIEAEQKHRDRAAGLRAAHEVFYQGPIAKRIVEFASSTSIRDASGRSHTALLRVEDLAGFSAALEDPVHTDYRGVTVYKCPPWTQGPVLCQSLNLLEQFDLASMRHNSAQYIHTVIECMKLAYADREFYYGDPKFADVPLGRLLSKEYAADRAKLVGESASMELRPGGREPIAAQSIHQINATFGPVINPQHGDTTKLEVIDSAGNMVSATPSGGWLSTSPVIPGLGFPLGTRGQMFSLVEGHPNCIAPGKRPRSTLTPSLAMRGGRGFMAFGSPGGDVQDQWALQAFLNIVEFGMGLQEAVEAPTFWSRHWPDSFYPRQAVTGQLNVETRIRKRVRDKLAARGHNIQTKGPWAGGNTLIAAIDPDTGLRCGAASPRLEPAYAAAY